MKIKRNQLLMIFLVTGFFIGIIYTNVVKTKSEIFNITVLENVKNLEIDYRRYLYHIVKERLGLLLLIVFLGQIYWKRIYAGLSTIVIGISLGSNMLIS